MQMCVVRFVVGVVDVFCFYLFVCLVVMKDLLVLLGCVLVYLDFCCWFLVWNFVGILLVLCGGDWRICIWGMEGDSWICKFVFFEGYQCIVWKVVWFFCGNYLVFVSFDVIICIWKKNQDDFECVIIFEGYENEVKLVVWVLFGNFLVICS